MVKKIEDIIIPKNEKDRHPTGPSMFSFGRMNRSEPESPIRQLKPDPEQRRDEHSAAPEVANRNPDEPLKKFLAQTAGFSREEHLSEDRANAIYEPGSRGKNAFLDTYQERRRSNEAFAGRDRRRPSTFSLFPILITIVLILAAIFIVLSVFTGATVNVVPVERIVSVSGEYTAKKDALAGELPFKLIVVRGKKTKEVPATIEETIERKASGQVVIYNEYSSASQRFIKNTRFATPNGKIYRINESIVVPGTTVVGGKTVPGSVEVTVYADAPGAEYNSDPTDFTIPGLKGEPRYGKFYGRSRTPLAGGFKGTIKTVSEAERANAEQELAAALKDELTVQATSQIPAGFVMFPAGALFHPDSVPEIPEEDSDTVAIVYGGALYALIFDEKELSRYLASATIQSYESDPVTIHNLRDLEFAVREAESYDPLANSTLRFSLAGNARIVWDVDRDAVAEALAGKEKAEFSTIITQFRSIQKAQASMKAFWKRSFPDDPDDIAVELDLAAP